MMKPIIFAGPSLDVVQASKILDAVYLPPAGHGDVLTLIENEHPPAIGLIDGIWNGQTVWPREIMLALDMGIPVYGASHLGALRAVELGPFGMRGVGRIFEHLSAQDFMDHAEVAATWDRNGDQYTRTSLPMANIRATLAAALKNGSLDKDVCLVLEEAAQRVYFRDRTWEEILKACAGRIPSDRITDLGTWLEANYVDQQAEDALELLKKMQTLEPLPVKEESPPWRAYRHVRDIRDRYGAIHRATGTVTRSEIVEYAALNLPEFHEVNFNALNRKLVLAMAEELGVKSDSELTAIEQERFRRREKLQDDNDFNLWLENNDLTPGRFEELMAERAVCHRLHRWLMQVRQPHTLNTTAVLEELKLRGDFPRVADKAAARAKLIREGFENPEQVETPEITDLFREHLKTTGIPWEYDWRLVIPEIGLSFEDFYWELHRSRLAREYIRDLVLGHDHDPERASARRPPFDNSKEL